MCADEDKTCRSGSTHEKGNPTEAMKELQNRRSERNTRREESNPVDVKVILTDSQMISLFHPKRGKGKYGIMKRRSLQKRAGRYV